MYKSIRVVNLLDVKTVRRVVSRPLHARGFTARAKRISRTLISACNVERVKDQGRIHTGANWIIIRSHRKACFSNTPCCNKVYTCRFCHDKRETHTVNRKEVTELICVLCDTRQPVQATCQNCHCRFGKYTCLECNLFDDEDKNQYHCDGCGICRVGGRDRFFHCAKCNMCLPIQLQNGHTCVENVSHANCPVCLEDIHTSRIPCHIPNCGHLLHRTCFEELLHSGHYACPICQVSLLDMTDLWRFLDMEVSLTPMPEEYRDYKVEILCKDCHEESTVKFHVVGLKCLNCGSYNTCRVKGSPSPDEGRRREIATPDSEY
ncbi:RING finger and CHY zinc finger domain-containing protein 1 isoform X2 [Colletes gigas]|uniref:RING finger and CHY zinc finger domain-containing protein 1 isoform X2 n=1 Tax=Colletes gigas TaxID=935657 RepID=UPI001C9B512F|nr:RING finger and CHY zinc finger domain-containing protein 1 isoform X2 [Colletes gigas]